MNSKQTPSVLLAEFLRLGKGNSRLESYQDAREFYVEYHALLAQARIYSCPGVLLSASRAAFRPTPSTPAPARTRVVVYDGDGANGLRTIANLGLDPLQDIRPKAFLTYLPARSRWRALARLSRNIGKPASFFASLFDLYAEVAQRELGEQPLCREVISANERSLGCAPFLASAKFRLQRQVTVVQHGNPIGDYLPTLADSYWCRSDRWFEYLRERAIVPDVRRIADFPCLDVVKFDPGCRQAVLVLHNVGYLEPDVDYAGLSERVKAACARAGWTLHALRHPANKEAFGLPEIDRQGRFPVALGIGFRSSATDQLPQGMPRVSLLDYWPDFFLRQGTPEQLNHFFSRIEEALA